MRDSKVKNSRGYAGGAGKMPVDTAPVAPEAPVIPAPSARSRVSNGAALFMLPDVDGRSVIARRYRDLYAEIVGDLGEPLSEAQRQIARRCAALSTHAELAEAALAGGQAFNVEQYVMVTNALTRAFGAIGLKRTPRAVKELSPGEWIAGGTPDA